jgi:predicted GIY-YIG superfamily endonuclease
MAIIGRYSFKDTIDAASLREKQLKGYRREKKINLIQKMNPGWQGLYQTLGG